MIVEGCTQMVREAYVKVPYGAGKVYTTPSGGREYKVPLGKVYSKGTYPGSASIAIEFYENSEKIGTLKIGKSTVIWKPPNAKDGVKIDMEYLIRLI